MEDTWLSTQHTTGIVDLIGEARMSSHRSCPRSQYELEAESRPEARSAGSTIFPFTRVFPEDSWRHLPHSCVVLPEPRRASGVHTGSPRSQKWGPLCLHNFLPSASRLWIFHPQPFPTNPEAFLAHPLPRISWNDVVFTEVVVLCRCRMCCSFAFWDRKRL